MGLGFGLGSIGFRALLGGFARKAAGNAVSDGRAVLGWLERRKPIELLALVLAGLVIFQHFSLIHTRHARDDAVAGRHEAVMQLVAALKALHNSQSNEQLLRAAITDRNSRIEQQSAQLATEQQQLAAARLKGAGAVADARAVAGQLAASARQKPAAGAACAPSETMKEQWQ